MRDHRGDVMQGSQTKALASLAARFFLAFLCNGAGWVLAMAIVPHAPLTGTSMSLFDLFDSLLPAIIFFCGGPSILLLLTDGFTPRKITPFGLALTAAFTGIYYGALFFFTLTDKSGSVKHGPILSMLLSPIAFVAYNPSVFFAAICIPLLVLVTLKTTLRFFCQDKDSPHQRAVKVCVLISFFCGIILWLALLSP
jgi:hypothetical protein